MKEFLATAKALSDENRVRALMFLQEGELCVCQIIEMLGLAPSTVSKHMATLHGAGLVETRKDGRWMFYRLADQTAATGAIAALRWVQESLADDSQVSDDATRLKAVRRTPVRELCRHYKA
jgi:DNA-binding transcriptional ArsR family regulator